MTLACIAQSIDRFQLSPGMCSKPLSKHRGIINPFTASCSKYCSKGSAPYWSNPPFLIFDIRAL